MPIQDYKIVAGWNGTPVNVESISVPSVPAISTVLSNLDSGTHFFVHAIGRYANNRQYTSSATVYNGYPVKVWTLPVVSIDALAYFRATYGETSPQKRKVTINTTLDTSAFFEKNAFCEVPDPDVLSPKLRSGLWVYENVEIKFKIVSDTA